MPDLHVADNRRVITYEPGGVTAGIITGYLDEFNGFVMEHITTFQGDALRPMIRTALEGPWPYRYIRLQILGDHPRAQGLRVLAQWAGFVEYDPGNWVLYPR